MSLDISAKARKILGDHFDQPSAYHSPSHSFTQADLSSIPESQIQHESRSAGRIFSTLFRRSRKRTFATSTSTNSYNPTTFVTARASRKPSLERLTEETFERPVPISRGVRRSVSSPDLLSSSLNGYSAPTERYPRPHRDPYGTSDQAPASARLVVPQAHGSPARPSHAARPCLQIDVNRRQSTHTVREGIYSPTQPSIHSSIFHQSHRVSTRASRYSQSNSPMQSQMPTVAQWFHDLSHDTSSFAPFDDDINNSDDNRDQDSSRSGTIRAPSPTERSDTAADAFVSRDVTNDAEWASTIASGLLGKAGSPLRDYQAPHQPSCAQGRKASILSAALSSDSTSTCSLTTIENLIGQGKSVLTLSTSDSEDELEASYYRGRPRKQGLACVQVPSARMRAHSHHQQEPRGKGHRARSQAKSEAACRDHFSPRRKPVSSGAYQIPKEPARLVPRNVEVSPEDARMLISMREKRLDLWRSKLSAGYIRTLENEIALLERVQQNGQTGIVRIRSDLLPPHMAKGVASGIGTLFPQPPRMSAHPPNVGGIRDCSVADVLHNDFQGPQHEERFGRATRLTRASQPGSPPRPLGDMLPCEAMEALDSFYDNSAGTVQSPHAVSVKGVSGLCKSPKLGFQPRSPCSNRTSVSQVSDVFSMTQSDSMPATPSTSYSFLDSSSDRNPTMTGIEPFPVELQNIVRRQRLFDEKGHHAPTLAHEHESACAQAQIEREWVESLQLFFDKPPAVDDNQAAAPAEFLDEHTTGTKTTIEVQIDGPAESHDPETTMLHQQNVDTPSIAMLVPSRVPEMILTPPTASHSRQTSTSERVVKTPVIDEFGSTEAAPPLTNAPGLKNSFSTASDGSLKRSSRAVPMLEERIRAFGTPVWSETVAPSPAAPAAPKPKGPIAYSLFPGSHRQSQSQNPRPIPTEHKRCI